MIRPPTSLLVPSERHVEAAALAGGTAKTFRRAVDELRALADPTRTPTTPEMTRLLAAQLSGLPIADASAIDEALGRLRRAGTQLSTLKHLGVGRARDFARWLDGANAALEQRALVDDRDAPRMAASQLQADAEAAADYAGHVVVRGLCRWDGGTLSFLEALHARLRAAGGAGVSLELTTQDVAPLASAVAALMTELETRWADVNDAPTLALVPGSAQGRAPLALIEAHDAASEARAVARSVLEGLERGVPIEQIAVVSTDLAEAFLEPLRFEFARAKIPFSEPRGRPVIAAPRAHAALSLLRLADGPLQRDVLRDVLALPGLRSERWFESGRAELGALAHELLSLPLRVERNQGELVQELADRIAEREAEEPGTAARLVAARTGLERWLEDLRRLRQPSPRREHARRARELFGELGLFQPRASTLSAALAHAAGGRPELLAGLGYDAVAIAAVEAALERTTAAAAALGHADEPVTLAHFLDELELSLESVGPVRGAAQAGAVRIARPEDVARLELGLLVLARASDVSLDRSPNVEVVLGAELTSALPMRERPPSSATEHHFRSLAVGSALADAREVVVTWARRDGTTTLAPSRLSLALSARTQPRREPASSLAAGAQRVVALPAASSGAAARSEIELRRLAFYASPSAEPDRSNGLAGDLSPFFGAVRPVAVTALESALRCAFLGFATTVLRAARRDPVSDAIGVRERGSLLHEALARALEATKSLWGLRTPSELTELGSAAAREFLATRGRTPLRRVGLESTLRDVSAVLAHVFSNSDALSFRVAEQAFGDGAHWPALEVAGKQLGGRIDRIDASLDGRKLRVIDYKTSLPSKNDETLLQPWLYALQAAAVLGAEEVEFSFLGLEKRLPKTRVVFSGQPDDPAISEALNKAARVAEFLAAGRVAARPASAANCPRCGARDICRRPLSAPATEGAED